MSAKHALVVDDSKSARIVLSRMLERYGIVVDTAESAESALDYLRKERPNVIFMDHLMPGMDGLEAVRIIKADPETASIPIMMYTSQEGELYVGQARALGAIGVLPKTIKPIDVTKVLFQLKLMPDRRDTSLSALQPVDERGEQRQPSALVEEEGLTRGMVEALLREQSLELRRFMVAALDSHAQRLVGELRPAEPEVPEEPPIEPAGRGWPWAWPLALLAMLAALLVLGGLYWQSLQTARDVEAARARLEVESTELKATLEEVRAAGRARQVAPAPTATSAARQHVLFVPYGEAPLGPPRLDAVRELVNGLERNGFRGRVQVAVAPGIFCLNGNAEAGYVLAPPEQPATECALRGNPFDESLVGAARQPVAFANLSASLERRTGGGILLSLVPAPVEGAISGYPLLERATAGAWNDAAAVNSRLEISVVPR